MEEGKWFSASIRIFGETLNPAEISRVLGLEPSRTHMRGEPRGRFGTAADSRWKHSLWCLQSPAIKESDPAVHFKHLLDAVEPRCPQIQELSQKYKVDLFCGFGSENGQGGFTLDPAVLKRLANLGIPLTLDLYPPAVPEEVFESE